MKYTNLPSEREDLLTPTNLVDVAEASLNAYSHNGAVVAVAHHMFETAGGRACHNNNFGNAKSHPSSGALFTYFSCTEVVNGQVVRFDPPSAECCFAAFDTAEAGLAAHLAMMKTGWSEAENLLVTAEPGPNRGVYDRQDLVSLTSQFCAALQRPAPRNGYVHAYFTDLLAHYQSGVVGWLPNARAALAIQARDFSSVQAFQQDAFLDADGVIGPKTRAALGLP